ncbi:uncharacterized protein PV06_11106 [Exophiala oligosperma]|uniref:Uncharacterized protein n=1 Tax=Exophiala oligosperma TaxID=215243 RepID=A0A0D2A8P3_9EURO|nr:uncharacterized protein PV06_11106 [Exophiala oligosperma]KIW36691.1 hypothetical protein PV06_11106 [Exophiala oligosperma]
MMLTWIPDKILWPLFHYQMHEIRLSHPDWEAYQEVNRYFAEALLPELRAGDAVWIQDYHLLLLPSFLRQALNRCKKDVKIGFFLHTVFPSSDFLRILPVREGILGGLLNCDLVGFHNSDYTDHFLQSCQKTMRLEVSNCEVKYEGRSVRVITCPIGIDPEEFHARLNLPKVQDRIKVLHKRYEDVKLIVSVDRLDYVKGIPLRMEAMEALLTKHPEHIGKVVLLQVLIPSREAVQGYRHLHHQIDESISRINGKFGLSLCKHPRSILLLTVFIGDIEYSPIQSQFCSVSKDELTALYAASDACIISSTRDGFNVVSLEYIACQRDRLGVLLLSEFAGAAAVLDDSIKFNPWDTDKFSKAIHQAVTMDEEEKRQRFNQLQSFVMRNTSQRWGQTFLDALQNTGRTHI